MAPLQGMLRTSIILANPAGFMDTSREQMNAGHFDGFMNTVDRRMEQDGEDPLFSWRSRPSLAILSPARSARASSSSWHRDGLALMEPRRLGELSLRLNHVGELKTRVSHGKAIPHERRVRWRAAIYLGWRYASKQSPSEWKARGLVLSVCCRLRRASPIDNYESSADR